MLLLEFWVLVGKLRLLDFGEGLMGVGSMVRVLGGCFIGC